MERTVKPGGTDDRGREARRPSDIPASGLRDVVVRVYKETDEDNVGLLAAAVAFYAFLGLFPALAAVISLWGVFGDPAAAQAQIMSMAGAMPPETRTLIHDQMRDLASSSGKALGLGAIVGLLLAIWSASRGVSALVDALNIAYDEKETRSFIRRTAITLALTLGGVLLVVIATAAVVVLPVVLNFLHMPQFVRSLIELARWPILALGVSVSLAVLYRFAPNRTKPKWEWVSWGSLVATVIWLGASFLFSFYVSHFGSYQKAYGSLAAVVILMLWLLVSAYSIIVGAELNAELEHQTRRDSTEGPEAPRGSRGAFVADTVGQTP